MVLNKLGNSLQETLKKLVGAGRIDKHLVDEVVKDIQRALLQSDVNVKLVMQLSKEIKRRSLDEKVLAGMSPKEHVVRIIYDELVKILGSSSDIQLKEQTIMMVGLQGSGKTTTVAKLARYFQKKGLKPAVICADTDRPGAYEQLKTHCDKMGVVCYGEPGSKDPVKIVQNGLVEIEKYDVKIIDTAGRHALESDLIKQMEEINAIAKPDHRLLILDAAIGQQASEQARVFHESVNVTGVIITKLDGTAKGGGAISAVSETKTSIAFIGSGETIEDIERFDSERFISRLLGMGDIKSLIERAEEALIEEDFDVEAMMRGKFTLKEMYDQMMAMNKLGPLKQIMQMLPLGGMGVKISDNMYEETGGKMKLYKIIMDSMNENELTKPKIIGSSRIMRIARGSGTHPDDVRELLKYYKTMQRAMKGLRGGKMNMAKIMRKFGG